EPRDRFRQGELAGVWHGADSEGRVAGIDAGRMVFPEMSVGSRVEKRPRPNSINAGAAVTEQNHVAIVMDRAGIDAGAGGEYHDPVGGLGQVVDSLHGVGGQAEI